jgi:hypothetical protein
MNLEGRPNRAEHGETFSRTGHDMSVRFNFNQIHEQESYHASPSLSRLQKPKTDQETFSGGPSVERLYSV